jgi:phosphoribosylformimino-5-aminoimidazole carboxamide ribotide isomerase
MIIFPAIDIKDGQCVRLKQGLADKVTVFSNDPVDMAMNWAKRGAKYLHVVDLDGAFTGEPVNVDLIKRLCSSITIPVQLGGGIRDVEIAALYLEAGIERVITGTTALTKPDDFRAMTKAFPGKVGVSLDAVENKLKTKGWVEDAGVTVFEILPELQENGAAFLVYTDISRDGMETGVNIEAMLKLVNHTELPVIASGGVHTLDDIQRLYPMITLGLEGVITGRAVYTGSLRLESALDWVASMQR